MKKTPWVLIFSLAVACTAENTNRSGLKPREADWSSINGGSSADSSNSVKDLNVLARTTGNQGEASADDSKISGPYKYKNIEIFLMHGKDRVKAGKILTLQEALKQNPDLFVGWGTYGWLSAASKSIAKIQRAGFIKSIKTEILFILSGDEKVVNNKKNLN